MIRRALVIGGGIGGMAAAAALRGVVGNIVVVERDRLPDEPAPRRGTPQSLQLHNLLGRAQQHLEELLPGFRDELLGAGGTESLVSTETHVWELGARMPERDLGLRLSSAPRPVIEHVARSVLLRLGEVTILDETRLDGLAWSAGGEFTATLSAAASGATTTIDAALVVDASGSSSAVDQWLSSMGATAPRVDHHQVRQWYATVLVRRSPAWVDANDHWMVFPTLPNTRGGLVAPLGTDEWYVSLSGRAADPIPRTVEDMVLYASTLEERWIEKRLAEGQAMGEPNVFRRPVATWRRFDLLDAAPPGFLQLGDALATLNPLFGQGMSVAVWQASELRNLLCQIDDHAPVAALTSAFYQRAAEVVATAWKLGEMVESRSDEHERTDLVTRLWDDVDFHREHVRRWHLLDNAREQVSA